MGPRVCKEAQQKASGSSSSEAVPDVAANAATAATTKVTVLSFKCPYHFCDTCFAFYGNARKDDLNKCICCPRAFHTNCIPPGSRYNTMCLLCPEHPDELLPSQDAVTASSVPALNSFAAFFDQLAIPEVIPSAADPFANHFKLVTAIQEDIENAHAPPEFVKIRKNDYDTLTNKKLVTTYNPEFCCDCTVTCGPMCLNRVSKMECCDVKVNRNNDPVCHVGAHCSNRAIQNREYADVEVAKEFQMGFGLRAVSDVPRGSLIIEYVGEVIDYAEVTRRMTAQRVNTPNDKDFYIMELDSGLYVDGKFKGNNSRFINHSCGPNAELQRWITKGHMRIAIVTLREVKAGEFFSYDYQFDTNEDDIFQCYCGAPSCRGTMAPKKKEKGGIPTNRAERARLIAMGRQKERNNLLNRVEDEWARSYTSKHIPGDALNEIKAGPVKSTFEDGREHKLFLVRNVLQSSNFQTRREAMESGAR